jgi:hypothetical protein
MKHQTIRPAIAPIRIAASTARFIKTRSLVEGSGDVMRWRQCVDSGGQDLADQQSSVGEHIRKVK